MDAKTMQQARVWALWVALVTMTQAAWTAFDTDSIGLRVLATIVALFYALGALAMSAKD